MQQNFLDFCFETMDSPKRSLDFCMIARLKAKMSPENLYTGAQQAFKCFPKSNCYLKSYKYKVCKEPWLLLEQSCPEEEKNKVIEDFLKKPFQVKRERGIKQLYLSCEKNTYLVTRMHHCLGDAVSFFSWLKVQLTKEMIYDKGLILKKSKEPRIQDFCKFLKENTKKIQKKIIGKNQLKKKWNFHSSTLLNTQKKIKISNQRKWISLSFEKPVRKKMESIIKQRLSYNDLLCAVLFETLREFKGSKKNPHNKYGLYLPINIRTDTHSGFGNGSSRIKIYDIYPDKPENYKVIAEAVRKQVNWCQKHESWRIPEKLGIIAYLPKFLSKSLLKIYSGLYFHDFGTLVFSHIERHGPLGYLFDYFSDVVSVSQLYKVYGMALIAMTFKNKTILTCTWDNNLFNKGEIKNFLDIFSKNREIAFKQLIS